MVARTVTGNEMRSARALSHGGQPTAEQDVGATKTQKQSQQRQEKQMTKKKDAEASVLGLFHTVSASTPRAKRLARVYPHSSATAFTPQPFRSNGGAIPAATRVDPGDGDDGDVREYGNQQGAGEEEEETIMATWRTTMSRRSSCIRHSFTKSEYGDDDDDESFSLLPTRIASDRSSSGASANASFNSRRSNNDSFMVETDEYDSDVATTPIARTRQSSSGDNNVEDDILSRIATLQVLCDEGFISSEEYERRKCAIVDELTFSSEGLATQLAATQPSRMSFRRSEGMCVLSVFL